MDSYTVVDVLLLMAALFAGRIWGASSEIREWMDASKTNTPLIRKGALFKVECIGGD